MQVFTEEFKDWLATQTAKVIAYLIVFGPIAVLIKLAFWFEASGY